MLCPTCSDAMVMVFEEGVMTLVCSSGRKHRIARPASSEEAWIVRRPGITQGYQLSYLHKTAQSAAFSLASASPRDTAGCMVRRVLADQRIEWRQKEIFAEFRGRGRAQGTRSVSRHVVWDADTVDGADRPRGTWKGVSCAVLEAESYHNTPSWEWLVPPTSADPF